MTRLIEANFFFYDFRSYKFMKSTEIVINDALKLMKTFFLLWQVTWIRRSDLKLLTIGKILYTQDQRFLPIHDDGSDVWILKLTNTQVKDSGEYECQVSYHEDVEKKLTMSISLKVLGKFFILKNS